MGLDLKMVETEIDDLSLDEILKLADKVKTWERCTDPPDYIGRVGDVEIVVYAMVPSDPVYGIKARVGTMHFGTYHDKKAKRFFEIALNEHQKREQMSFLEQHAKYKEDRTNALAKARGLLK